MKIVPFADAIRDAANRLSDVSETPRLDAELLAAHSAGLTRMGLMVRMAHLKAPLKYEALIDRRAANEPVAYIIGRQPFWDFELRVTPDVLIPRADSETLIEASQGYFSDREPPAQILDLGTGSGALLLAALSLYPAAQGIGIDASAAALAVANDNAQKLNLADRTKLHEASWADAEWNSHFDEPFDLILCNPPYVESEAELSPMVKEYEPHSALFAGPQGLDDYRIIIPQIPTMLTEKGIAILEIGATQADAVTQLAHQAGLSTDLRYDLAKKPRCIIMRIGVLG